MVLYSRDLLIENRVTIIEKVKFYFCVCKRIRRQSTLGTIFVEHFGQHDTCIRSRGQGLLLILYNGRIVDYFGKSLMGLDTVLVA
jgi:hypothetical protein